jgi:hypothetical protein
VKAKNNQKLWLLKWQLEEGKVQKHPFTKELEFVPNPVLTISGEVYTARKKEAYDVTMQSLLELQLKELKT